MAEGNGKSKLLGKILQGKVVWFDREKGHGFLRPDGFSESDRMDIFVHYSGIAETERRRRNLLEDQRVIFKVIPDERREGEVKSADVKVTR